MTSRTGSARLWQWVTLNGDGVCRSVISGRSRARRDWGNKNGEWTFLNNGLGKVYVFLSQGASGLGSNISSSNANTILKGEFNGDDFGWSLAIGDVNGDGNADVIVGADTYKSCNQMDQTILNPDCQGRTYVFISSSTGLASTSISAANASTILDAANDPGNFGYSLAVTDVNGDGFQDLLVGGDGADGTGKVYLFSGSNAGFGSNFVHNTSATTIISGPSENNQKDSFGDSED